MTRNLLVAMTVMAIGCGVESTDDAQPDVVEDAAKADVIYPSGSYNDSSAKLGEIASLTLNASKTFDRRIQTIDCVPQLHCDPTQHGTYKFTYSGSTRYIRFYDSDGALLDRFQWKLTTKTLSLREIGTNNWQYLKPATDYAQEGQSCGGFVANPKQCAPGLDCVFTGVPDVPGKCVNPKTTACAQAGGSCVALVPGNCDNGAVGDARQYSCGGGLGVECCLPAPAPTGPACNSDSDCGGFLPQFCRVCDNGKTSCAHWSCEQKHCTIATCN